MSLKHINTEKSLHYSPKNPSKCDPSLEPSFLRYPSTCRFSTLGLLSASARVGENFSCAPNFALVFKCWLCGFFWYGSPNSG